MTCYKCGLGNVCMSCGCCNKCQKPNKRCKICKNREKNKV